jgi:two-component system, chemotaxis family, sensor kinase CheA
VAELAAERGLPHACEADWVQALLSDGFTTRATVSTTSGRGVGMSAVYQEVQSLGGVLSVDSQLGVGTCWRLVLPLRASTARSVCS